MYYDEDELAKELINQITEAEMKIIEQCLLQHLGRPVLETDFSDLSIDYKNSTFTEKKFYYKDEFFGTIFWNLESLEGTFKPAKELDTGNTRQINLDSKLN